LDVSAHARDLAAGVDAQERNVRADRLLNHLGVLAVSGYVGTGSPRTIDIEREKRSTAADAFDESIGALTNVSEIQMSAHELALHPRLQVRVRHHEGAALAIHCDTQVTGVVLLAEVAVLVALV